MKKWILTPEKFLKEEEVKRLRTFMEEKAIVAITKRQKKPIRDWAIIDIALSAGLRATTPESYLFKSERNDKITLSAIQKCFKTCGLRQAA